MLYSSLIYVNNLFYVSMCVCVVMIYVYMLLDKVYNIRIFMYFQFTIS